MEFEELKMIWDQQNSEPLYAINEETLHKRIRKKLEKSRHKANVEEIGLILIFLFAGTFLTLTSDGNFFSYLTAAGALFIVTCITIIRRKRKKKEAQFEASMLGDLDHAIANQDYFISGMRKFLFWIILPIAIPSLLNLYFSEKRPEPWQWAIAIGSYILGYLVVQVSLVRKHLPKRKALEALRQNLIALQAESDFPPAQS